MSVRFSGIFPLICLIIRINSFFISDFGVHMVILSVRSVAYILQLPLPEPFPLKALKSLVVADCFAGKQIRELKLGTLLIVFNYILYKQQILHVISFPFKVAFPSVAPSTLIIFQA